MPRNDRQLGLSRQDTAQFNSIEKLTSAMAAGNADAVACFYRDYFDWLYIQARLSTRRDESFCLDVVQDATLRIMQSIKPVASEACLAAWLRLVVQSTALDLLRSERRRVARESLSAGSEAVRADASAGQLDWLAEQVNRFDPQLKQIIELKFEQKWTLRRIGELLGLTTSAVDGRFRRALKRLRESSDDCMYDEAGSHDDTV